MIDRFVARYGCRADLIKIDTAPQKKLAESAGLFDLSKHWSTICFRAA